MAQKKQKQIRTKRKVKLSDFAKEYKKESYRQSKASNPLAKYGKSDLDKIGKFYKDAMKSRPELGKMAKRIPKKSLGKRLVGGALSKAIPGATAAVVAHDVMRAGAKKGCIKRGGKWVKGKCQGVTKSKSVTSGKDPRFAKSRSKK